jgi:hypothetical protein
MDPDQIQRCLTAMDALQKYHISSLFSQPVDPIRDGCPNYFQVIHHPMDLSTARHKLESGQYATVEQWKSDIDLIWTNTVTFSGTKSLLTVLAKQLQTTFREITASLSSDPGADWRSKFEKIKSDMNGLIRTAPKVSVFKLKKPLPGRSLSMPNSPKCPPKVPQFEHVQEIGMSSEEIAKLATEVNLIEDTAQIDEIIALIREKEPEYRINDDEDDEMELDISKLAQPTLCALRELVARLLGR